MGQMSRKWGMAKRCHFLDWMSLETFYHHIAKTRLILRDGCVPPLLRKNFFLKWHGYFNASSQARNENGILSHIFSLILMFIDFIQEEYLNQGFLKFHHIFFMIQSILWSKFKESFWFHHLYFLFQEKNVLKDHRERRKYTVNPEK